MGNSTKPKAIYRNPTTKITVFKHVSQSNNNKKGTYIKYSCIHTNCSEMEPMISFHEKRFHAVGGFIITKSYGRLQQITYMVSCSSDCFNRDDFAHCTS